MSTKTEALAYFHFTAPPHLFLFALTFARYDSLSLPHSLSIIEYFFLLIIVNISIAIVTYHIFLWERTMYIYLYKYIYLYIIYIYHEIDDIPFMLTFSFLPVSRFANHSVIRHSRHINRGTLLRHREEATLYSVIL